MPFADYEDFDECTTEHSDKNDPEAYCSEIHKRVTGEYPGQKTAAGLYDRPETFMEYALDAMHETGTPATEEKLDAIKSTADSLRDP